MISANRSLSAMAETGMNGNMDYESFFKQSVDTIKDEGRYRVFANLERQAGNYPHAINRLADATENVVVW